MNKTNTDTRGGGFGADEKKNTMEERENSVKTCVDHVFLLYS